MKKLFSLFILFMTLGVQESYSAPCDSALEEFITANREGEWTVYEINRLKTRPYDAAIRLKAARPPVTLAGTLHEQTREIELTETG